MMRLEDLPNYLNHVNTYALEHPRNRREALNMALGVRRNTTLILEACHPYREDADDTGLIVRDIRREAMELRIVILKYMATLLVSSNKFGYNLSILKLYDDLAGHTALLFDYLAPELTERLEAAL